MHDALSSPVRLLHGKVLLFDNVKLSLNKEITILFFPILTDHLIL